MKEVEKKIDGIYSLLLPGPSVQNHNAILTPESSTSPSHDQLASPNEPSLGNVVIHFTDDQSLQWSTGSHSNQDIIERGLISSDEANTLLEIFKSNYGNFPFVHVPPLLSLNSFRRERPHLLLAILTVASRKHQTLQQSLEW